MNPFKEIPHVSVAYPRGFKAAGINAGIKMSKKDMAIVVSEVPARVAGTFTTNAFAAAPVRWCREVAKRGVARAVITNSGNANACTGVQGFRDAKSMAKLTALELGIPMEEVFVSSTGVIGKRLPMETIETGIKKITKLISKKGDIEACHAILTTDTFSKTVALELTIGGKKVRLGAMAKGAGMIQPAMATMLCYITTDALVESSALQQALKTAVNQSFNCITVDGDMSTNDSVILFANGQAGNQEVILGTHEYDLFMSALSYMTLKLAKLIVTDGEGATKLVKIDVTGALTDEDAKRAAFSIGNCNLFKVSLYAQEPNWGRLMAALGSSGVNGLDEDKVNVKFNSRFFVKKGRDSGIKRGVARKVMRAKEIDILVQLGLGSGKGTVWTCDLTHRYVDINM